ncbi:MAG TPA: hypothetical protein VN380_12720 [Thermoanaerobaculia bacterium]|nr:hypothetical protein [Thermoanaerobaculia bacterium]
MLEPEGFLASLAVTAMSGRVEEAAYRSVMSESTRSGFGLCDAPRGILPVLTFEAIAGEGSDGSFGMTAEWEFAAGLSPLSARFVSALGATPLDA